MLKSNSLNPRSVVKPATLALPAFERCEDKDQSAEMSCKLQVPDASTTHIDVGEQVREGQDGQQTQVQLAHETSFSGSVDDIGLVNARCDAVQSLTLLLHIYG